ncbi:MAG: penicillin-binding protein activator LpoB [Planctomycetaceae bacterium]|jgi:PBP1b-binding outer membrane lipoprotein LpoB|nr:penicillin-binding protein activator LpoB [Planctomycetaceae bacterium]|tara:strand:+ start:1672 stop:2280 length:609 start_codon:yes stop_codon:yes gene_type:complete
MKLTLQTTVALAVLCGCGSINDPTPSVPTELNPDERGFAAGLGPESQDLVVVAEKMARDMIGVDQIANAEGKPSIVLAPVINETRFPINKDIFLTRMRVTLMKNASSKLNFLARDRIDELEKERLLKLSGQVTGGEKVQANEFKGADYILTGKLSGISGRGKAGASDYILYTFQLLDPRTSVIVWEGYHETKKQGLDDFIYR